MSDEGPSQLSDSLWGRRWNVDKYLLATWLAIAITLMMVVVVSAGLTIARYTKEDRPLAFNAERWHATPIQKDDGTTRRGMAMRLISDGTLIGLSRADVEEMLGTPTATVGAGSSLRYDLGWRGEFLGFVVYTLQIDFGNDAVVHSASIQRHSD